MGSRRLRTTSKSTATARRWRASGSFRACSRARASPGEAGFDTYCLWNIPGGARERYWKPSFVQNGKLLDLPPDTFGPDVMTDFLIDFMTEENDKPFVAYYPMILVHDPFVPTPDSKGGTRADKAKRMPKQLKQNYVDMVAYMDKCVGRLVDALQASGQRDNTLVIFTGDNGTNAVLASELKGKTVKGGKGYTHDYGTHVPLVVNLPGRVPPGQVNDDLIAFSDFFPTIVEAVGLPAKEVNRRRRMELLAPMSRAAGANTPVDLRILLPASLRRQARQQVQPLRGALRPRQEVQAVRQRRPVRHNQGRDGEDAPPDEKR